ncbi:hypothetical protein [Massilia rhizosphaerae]|uniref:hypothetical protein n=1 Tax=Massilia rhizosphaerae TaxID=2784389 RepID=UPI0018DE1C61|nr:hypothetical protein [Massilia rhizosphaerae]
MQTTKQTTGMGARILQAVANGAFCDDGRAITSFALVRHFVRENYKTTNDRLAQLRRARRQAKMLGDSPFNKHRQSAMQKHIESLEACWQSGRDCQKGLGRIIIDMAPRIDAQTTMAQRLELLNCNPADRSDLDEPDIGLVNLIAVYCVEDSAAYRGDEFNDRPLFNAVNAEIMRVMFKTPEGRAASEKIFDEAFAPGGIFHGVPTYYRQSDGTMKRKAPSLVLHDASGSRVIERTPS